MERKPLRSFSCCWIQGQNIHDFPIRVRACGGLLIKSPPKLVLLSVQWVSGSTLVISHYTWRAKRVWPTWRLAKPSCCFLICGLSYKGRKDLPFKKKPMKLSPVQVWKPELILYMGGMVVSYCSLRVLGVIKVVVPVNHIPIGCMWMAPALIKWTHGGWWLSLTTGTKGTQITVVYHIAQRLEAWHTWIWPLVQSWCISFTAFATLLSWKMHAYLEPTNSHNFIPPIGSIQENGYYMRVEIGVATLIIPFRDSLKNLCVFLSQS